MASASASAPAGVNTYDQAPYPAASHAQTHPNRLAAIARLFGVAAVDPGRARVLELGCADGTNLLPMAEGAPEGTFLGLDMSQVQIAEGTKAVAAAGLKNVELRRQDILEFPADAGKFDYIIVHGVFSWVPEPVREKILAICSAHLSDNGVAYISYNAHPGWNMRRSLRDMMLFHTRSLSDPKAKVQQARALLAFMAETVPTEKNAYGQFLQSELAFLGGQPDNYLLHDILEVENTAFYFHEFVAGAARHGMQYLGEPSIAEMLAANFPDKVRETLGQLNNQIVAQEQYMDFIRNRSFRQTLLCRAGVRLQRSLSPANLRSFAFRSQLKSGTGPIDLAQGGSASFTTFGGIQIASTDAFVKATLLTLAESNGAAAFSYAELLAAARARSRPFLGLVPPQRDEIDEVTLQENLFNLLAKGFVDLCAAPVAVRADVPEKPAVGPLARHQAMNARLITNRIHQSIPADALARYVVVACDGTRTRDGILAEVAERVREGKLQVNEGTTRLTDGPKVLAALRPAVEAALTSMAKGGFFAP